MSTLAWVVIGILGTVCFGLAVACLVMAEKVRSQNSWHRRGGR